MQNKITYWFPGGLNITYSGTRKTRWQWIRQTWRGYLGMWELLIRAAILLNKKR